jgi:hypothetical protein
VVRHSLAAHLAWLKAEMASLDAQIDAATEVRFVLHRRRHRETAKRSWRSRQAGIPWIASPHSGLT